jgi:hypothetical protein
MWRNASGRRCRHCGGYEQIGTSRIRSEFRRTFRIDRNAASFLDSAWSRWLRDG